MSSHMTKSCNHCIFNLRDETFYRKITLLTVMTPLMTLTEVKSHVTSLDLAKGHCVKVSSKSVIAPLSYDLLPERRRTLERQNTAVLRHRLCKEEIERKKEVRQIA